VPIQQNGGTGIEEAANLVLIGSNGLGKTMLLKNLVHRAIMHVHTARFTAVAKPNASARALQSVAGKH